MSLSYRFSHTITLVTIASPIPQNLTLLEFNELISSNTLACIHEGYINIIPIFDLERRCKYVPLEGGDNRGKGTVKQVKWVKLNEEVLFVVASTIGLQIYGAEVCNLRFSHKCRASGNNNDHASGICVIDNNILCTGTNWGAVWMFQGNRDNSDFKLLDIFHAHETAITQLDGMSKYLVSSCHSETCLWVISEKLFQISRRIYVEGLTSPASALKVTSYLIFIGYESGEFCVFDILNSDFHRRTVAHKLKITGIDFSLSKHLVLTASEDCYIKTWTFTNFSLEGVCVFSIFNESGPVCGVAFLNKSGTEICAATADSINVNVYKEE